MTGWTVRGLRAQVGGFRLGPVDLELEDGNVLAVVGPSGAGKTTLLRALAGVQRCDDGSICHGTVDLSERPPERRKTAYVPQGLGLFVHRTVRQNVTFPVDLLGEDPVARGVPQLLERFGLGALAHRRPSTLSTGEQQRVAIARALAAAPDLLLWDEPLTGLDLLAREDLVEALREVRDHEKVSMILVTHDPAIAFSLADRMLVLDTGRVRFLGTPGTLVGAPPTRFAARFVGYENVYAASELELPGAPPLAEWLRTRCGSEGVALSTPEVADVGPWPGTVRGVEPGPTGFHYRVDAGGVRIRLRGPATSPLAPGDELRFSLDERSIARLDGEVTTA